MSKIKLGILGGGEDSLIGVLHRVASSMFDKYEVVGGVFDPTYDKSLNFGKNWAWILIGFTVTWIIWWKRKISVLKKTEFR